ncbi:MAG: chemotaxis protein CheW [Lachnospiraceae bacterium]|nr:chemotaxis protein CheW [Lachnospiraceae bacterium]
MDNLKTSVSPAIGYYDDEDGYEAPKVTQFIVVRFGEEQYGIDIKYIDNIVRMQQIRRVPEVPSYIKGVINLRGEVIPVMSARIKMNLEEDVETKATRIIILKLDQHDCIGILVDEVKEVVNLEEGQIDKVSYEAKEDKSNFIYGIGKYEGGLISLLDVNLVISGAETI